MYYYNKYKSPSIVKCNACDREGLISKAGCFQLYHGTHEYYGWTKTEYNEILCPTCSEKLKEGVKRVKFNIVTTRGFSDKDLIREALTPLKKLGHTFVTDIRNTAVVEVARELGLPITFEEVEADVTLLFHHAEEDVQHLINNINTQVHRYVSNMKKEVNPYLEHLTKFFEKQKTETQQQEEVNQEETHQEQSSTDVSSDDEEIEHNEEQTE
jgi:hypothetical protein